ncbi:electron transporter [Flavobacteriaceae bacterium (ex Bugula neritina AB1)]|nr:electron transporter [Flavobacteriaceae bacterium (ex Bugula neritina AB1)]
MKYFLLLCIGLVFMFSCKKQENKSSTKTPIDQLPYFISSDFTPHWYTSSNLEGKHKIPDFKFINQNGDTITNESYKNTIYIVDFFFTVCPGICPQLTKNMSLIQDKYIDDQEVRLLSHTVMPWHDSVPVLKEYAVKNGINQEKWNLVTGNKEEIYRIAREGYFADEDFVKTKDADSFIHTENFILVDKNGYIRGVYNGTIPLDVKRLMRHIEILKTEV